MLKAKYLFFIIFFEIAGLLSFAISSHAHSDEGQTSNGCFLSAHGDVSCPDSPKANTSADYPGIMPELEKTDTPIGGGLVFLPPESRLCKGGDPFDAFVELAKTREGYSKTVYRDFLGKLTVGVGHLVLPEDNLKLGDVISDERAMKLFYKDSETAYTAAMKQTQEAGICEACFVAALASVNYQMGTGWTKKFPNVWRKIKNGDYNGAADKLEDSLWKEQTPIRVKDFQSALRELSPKMPSCEMKSTSIPPKQICDIAPEYCQMICYGDFCHCRMANGGERETITLNSSEGDDDKEPSIETGDAGDGVPVFSQQSSNPACTSEKVAGEQMAHDLGVPRIGMEFKDEDYEFHGHPSNTSHGYKYMAHLGTDFPAPVSTPVKAITDGIVVAVLGNPDTDILNAAIIVKDPNGIYWAYGHLNGNVRQGDTITRGMVMGTIANPKGVFSAHTHISALKIPVPNSSAAVNDAMGWGRAYGDSQAEADANADRYAYDPVLAYQSGLCGGDIDSQIPTDPGLRCLPGTDDRPDPVISGRTYNFSNHTGVSQSLGYIRGYDSVLIENNEFEGGHCAAIMIDPCTVRNVIIRNNTFRNWTNSCPEPLVYIGRQASHSNCRANILVEGNTFVNTSTFKRDIEIKTSNVTVRNNVGDRCIEVRHGVGNILENNSFACYQIFGNDHVLRNNRGGAIMLGDGQIVQGQVAPHSGYPAATNILLQGNQSSIRTFCWLHSAASGCPVKATYRIIP